MSRKRQGPPTSLGSTHWALLRVWFKSVGRDQVSLVLGTGEGQRQQPPGTPKPLDAESQVSEV